MKAFLIIGITLVSLLFLICLIYILALNPGRRRKGKADVLMGKCVAHRGLFDNEEEIGRAHV